MPGFFLSIFISTLRETTIATWKVMVGKRSSLFHPYMLVKYRISCGSQVKHFWILVAPCGQTILLAMSLNIHVPRRPLIWACLWTMFYLADWFASSTATTARTPGMMTQNQPSNPTVALNFTRWKNATDIGLVWKIARWIFEHLERLSILANLFCLFRSGSVISSYLPCKFANGWLPKMQTSEKVLDFWIRSESKVSTSCACMVSSPMTSVEGRHNGRSCGVVFVVPRHPTFPGRCHDWCWFVGPLSQ